MPEYCKKTKRWRGYFRRNGKKYTKRGFSSKRYAEMWEVNKKRELEQIELGIRDASHVDTSQVYIQDIFDKFLQDYSKGVRESSFLRTKRSLAVFSRFLQSKSVLSLDELTPVILGQYPDWRNVSARTLEIDLINARKALLWGEKVFGYAVGDLKALLTPKKTKYTDIPKYLTLDEIAAIENFLTDCNQYSATFTDIFKVLVRTGMRTGELRSLQLSNIDFSSSTIRLTADQCKSGKARSIPYCPVVAEILQRCRAICERRGNTIIFQTKSRTPFTHKQIWYTFNALLKRMAAAGKIDPKGISLHTLRKTYISQLIMAGEDPVKVMAIVGHEDWQTIKRYLALSPDYLKTDKLPY